MHRKGNLILERLLGMSAPPIGRVTLGLSPTAGAVPGYLPTWVTPEQIRLMPMSEEYVSAAKEMAKNLRSKRIRVSVDDTDATVGKKVRKAKQDWCSYSAVIGENELKSGRLKVYVRSENKDIDMTPEELVSRIKKETEGYPVRPMYLPAELSKRCEF